MKKRILALLLTLVLCLGLLPVSALADDWFVDVPQNAWYYEDVRYAVSLGLVNGKTTTTYEPDSYITVAEVVKLAACMHQLATQGHVSLQNGPTVWYSTYEAYAINNGILYQSYAAASEYQRYATRMEFMSIFARALPEEDLEPINEVVDNAIPDQPILEIGGEAIYKLYRAGVVQGDANHYANPEENIKRSEVAAIVARMMDITKRISFSMTTVSGNGVLYDDDGSFANFRSLLNAFGVVCGVAYLGYVEDWSDVRYNFFNEEGWIYAKAYPFLTAIDMSHWVSNDGNELYAIVPADPNATVQVYDCFMGEKGNLLYQSNTGAPILVKGNISEIYSNLNFVITDSQGGNVDYELQLSGMDGSLMMPADPSAMYNFTLNMDDFLEPQPLGPDPYWEYDPFYSGGDIDYSYVPFAGYWVSETSFFNAVEREARLVFEANMYGDVWFNVIDDATGLIVLSYSGTAERTSTWNGGWYGILSFSLLYNNTDLPAPEQFQGEYSILQSSDGNSLEVGYQSGSPLLSGLDGYFSVQTFYNNAW